MNFKILFTILLNVLFVYLSVYLAKRKNRSITAWFFMGILLGFFSVILLLILPVRPQIKPRNPPNVIAGKWFYLDKEKKNVGPLSWDELLSALQTIHNNEEVWVWRKGMETWEKIKNLPMLYEAVQEKKNTMP